MRIAVALFCMTACLSTTIVAQQQTTPSTDKPSTEELVKRAHAAKAVRKKSSTKVITNKDVKKSKGKLIELSTPEKPLPKAATIPTVAEQDAAYHERKSNDEKLTAAQKKVDELQKQLDAIEQQYYAENDPNYRDNVLQQRFRQTKRQLEDAQHELADARDAAQKVTPAIQK